MPHDPEQIDGEQREAKDAEDDVEAHMKDDLGMKDDQGMHSGE